MLKRSSVPGSIVEFALSGVIIPVLNNDIVNEYRTVLLRPKFHLTRDIVDDMIQALEESCEYVDPKHLDVKLPDPKDAVFYEVVMEKRREAGAYLVTGNIKHFPLECFIVTPREMFELILSQNLSIH